MKIQKIQKSIIFLLFFIHLSKSYLVNVKENTFNETLKEKPYSLILFYNQFCSPSINIIDQFEKLSFISSDKKYNGTLSFLKVDLSKESNLALRLKIRGSPTLLLYTLEFDEFDEFVYDVSDLKYFIDIRIFKTFEEVSSIGQCKHIIEKNKLAILVAGDCDMEIIANVAGENPLFYFFKYAGGLTDEFKKGFFILEPKSKGDSKCIVQIFRTQDNFDMRFEIRKDIHYKKLRSFIAKYGHPRFLTYFNHRIRDYFSYNEKHAIALFSHKKTFVESNAREMFKNATRDLKRASYLYRGDEDNFLKYNGEFLKNTTFMILDPKQKLVRRLMQFIGIKGSELPLITAFNFGQNKQRIYKMKFDDRILYNPKDMIIRSNSALQSNNREHSTYMKSNSEPIKNTVVMSLNQNSFENLFMIKERSRATLYLIEFSSPYCIHSKKVSIAVENFAKKLNKFEKAKIIVARVNVYDDDFTKEDINEVPVIRLYFTRTNYHQFLLGSFDQFTLKTQLDMIMLQFKPSNEHMREEL